LLITVVMTTKKPLRLRREKLLVLTLKLAPVTIVLAAAGCDVFFTAPCSV